MAARGADYVRSVIVFTPATTIWTRALRSQTAAARENARQAAGLLRARRAELEEVERFLLEDREQRSMPVAPPGPTHRLLTR